MDKEVEYREDLDYESLRHKLLSILVRQRIDAEIYHKKKDVVLGVPFPLILEELQITREELFIVASKLFQDSEIDYYSVDFDGYFAKDKGVVTYFSKKYIKTTKKEKRKNIKYYYQIVVPILSLLIAVMSIGFNIYQATTNENKSQMDELELKVKSINEKLSAQEEKLKLEKSDSLIISN